MNPLKLSFITLLAASACSSPPKPVAVEPKPLSKAQVRRDYLKPADIKRVRTGEFVKTYHVGRSVRGRSGSTMHEAHRVYRLEKPSRWNLARNQPPLASTGPVNQMIDSAFKPTPKSTALRAELNRQRELSAELTEARDQLKVAVKQTADGLTHTATALQENQKLQGEIDRLEAENAALNRALAHETSSSPNGDPERNTLKEWGDKLEASDGN